MRSYEFQRKNNGVLEASAHYQFFDDNAACFIADRIIRAVGVTIEVWEGPRLVYPADTNALVSGNVSMDPNKDPEPRA